MHANYASAGDRLLRTGLPRAAGDGQRGSHAAGSLERQRATFAWKSADLDSDGLRAGVGVSTVTLGGLLKHLAFMEDINFTRDLAGGPVPSPWVSVDWTAQQDWEWRSAAEDTPEQLYALWRAAVDRSRPQCARPCPAAVRATGTELRMGRNRACADCWST